MKRRITFTLNGRPAEVTCDDSRALLWILRSDLGLTGTKFGCGEGLCGACTVMIGDRAARSCQVQMKEVAGAWVLTIEGLADGARLHPLQEAFVEHSAFQCGYCTSGMILNAYALLLKNADPGREEILREMDGNLCRCGSHPRIVAAIQAASAALRGHTR